jgi:hypothetical protein
MERIKIGFLTLLGVDFFQKIKSRELQIACKEMKGYSA